MFKNGWVFLLLRKFLEIFKRKGFVKLGMIMMKLRNGSILSDSGEGFFFDFCIIINELEKFSLEILGENG